MELNKRKKIVIIITLYLIAIFVLYLYCLPNSAGVLGEVLLKSIFASLFGFALVSQIKLTKWTGALEYASFREVSKLLPFVFSVRWCYLLYTQ